MLDKWNSVQLMVEMMVTTMVFVSWRCLKYLLYGMQFSLEQEYLTKYIQADVSVSAQQSAGTWCTEHQDVSLGVYVSVFISYLTLGLVIRTSRHSLLIRNWKMNIHCIETIRWITAGCQSPSFVHCSSYRHVNVYSWNLSGLVWQKSAYVLSSQSGNADLTFGPRICCTMKYEYRYTKRSRSHWLQWSLKIGTISLQNPLPRAALSPFYHLIPMISTPCQQWYIYSLVWSSLEWTC